MNDVRDRPQLRLVGETDDHPSPAEAAPAGLGSTHPMRADLVGRVVAGLAITVELLRNDGPAIMKGAIADADRPVQLIIEWGISLAWSNNGALTFADEALIDRTVRVLRYGIACLDRGAQQGCEGDPVQLRYTLVDTVCALAESL